MAETREHGIGGLIFVACMFIGAGIGLLFKRPDVGGAIGMGIGFLLLAIVRTKVAPVEVKVPSTSSGYLLILIGAALVVGGLGTIYFPHAIYPYLPGALAVLLGVGFLVIGARRIGSK
jgi:peptidoglycan/LPS O-acetylase OafA/YrhL